MSGLKSMFRRFNIEAVIFTAVLTAVVAVVPATYASAENKRDYDKMLEIVKDELKNNDLDSEEDVRKALEEASKKYDVELTEKETEKIVGVMNTINKMNIDKDTLIDIVDDVYDKVDGKLDGTTSEALDIIEEQVIESATEAVKQNMKKSFTDYFNDFWNTISGFMNRYFG